MSTPVSGSLAVTPLYATGSDAIVLWDDSGQTWRSLGTLPVGGGTVTSISGGTGITVSPSPIVGAGTVSLTVPVSVANGGTGTSTVMTAGSVMFAGPGGVHAQDNANLFWDGTNHRLGLGTATPSALLDVNGTVRATNSPAPTSGAGVEISYNTAAPRGYVFAYDRTAGALRALGIYASPVMIGSIFDGPTLYVTGGNVGIGTGSPSAQLDVVGAVRVTGPSFPTVGKGIEMEYNVGSDIGYILAYDRTGSAYKDLSFAGTHVWIGPTINSQLVTVIAGGVGIGTGAPGSLLTVNGVCANVSGAWTTISDRSTKEEITPYTRGLEAIIALNPVQFRYAAGTPFADPLDMADRPLMGLIEDEVSPHVPEICGRTTALIGKGEAATTVSTLEPSNLIYAVINSIKSLDVFLKELAARVEQLERSA